MSVTSNSAIWANGGVDISRGKCPVHIDESEIHGGHLSRIVPECSAQGPAGRLLVIGDSHAFAYQAMLWRFSMSTGVTVLLYRKPGCSYLSLVKPLQVASVDCQAFTNQITTEMLREAHRGDVLFLPSLRLTRLGEQYANFDGETNKRIMSGLEATTLRADAVNEAVALLQPYADKGIHVVFEAPKPIFRAPLFRCADWFNKTNPICEPGFEMSRADLLAYRQPVMQSYATIAKHVDGLLVWDPFPILCPEELCKAMVNGNPLFFDGDHVSGFGQMYLFDGFKNFFLRLLGDRSTQ